MFNPSREQVRRFFFDTWGKYRAATPLQGVETVALEIILLHPEYHGLLEAPGRSADRDYTPEMGQINPFLHLSLHMALEEQLAIDQPAGVRSAFNAILGRSVTRHDASHAALECLGEMMWKTQRDGVPPDAEGYLECLKRR